MLFSNSFNLSIILIPTSAGKYPVLKVLIVSNAKLDLNRHDQTISKKSLGLRSSISGFSMLMTPAGWATTLLVEILVPFLLASVFFLSFSRILLRKSTREVESLRCSTRTWMRLGIMRWRTCLLTMTPMARGLTLKTVPVRPWQNLQGIPLWMAPSTTMSTMSPILQEVRDLAMWMAPCCLKPFLNLCLVLRLYPQLWVMLWYKNNDKQQLNQKLIFFHSTCSQYFRSVSPSISLEKCYK